VDEEAVVPAEHTEVSLTRSWATATSGGSLLEGSRTLARGPTLARQPELVGDRIGTSLAPQISEALEAEASVGETEVFPKRLTDRSPQRCWSEA